MAARARNTKTDALLDRALEGLPGAELRPGQRAMADAVTAALRDGEHLLVQAGTGTGKSLAYLVPALASGKQVVIATATKALQAQLIAKDLPRLVAALADDLGRTPVFALAKGRSNYVCRQQVSGGPAAVDPEPDALFEAARSTMGRQVQQLGQWMAQTDTGDRDDVPFPVSDLAWRQVSVSARDCLGARCPDRVECFAEQARENAREADLVVANHALLALDATTAAAVLPEHDVVIIDEAHEFTAAANDALTKELSARDLRRAVSAAQSMLGTDLVDRLTVAQGATEGLLDTCPPGLLTTLPDGASETLTEIESALSAAVAALGRAAEGEGELDAAQRERARSALGELATAAHELRIPSVPSAVYGLPAGTGVALRVSPLAVGDALAATLFTAHTVVATSATLTLGGSFDFLARSLGLDPTFAAEVGAIRTVRPRPSVEPDEGAAGEPDEPAEDDPTDLESRARVWRYLDVGSPFDAGRQGQLWVAAELPDPGREPQGWARGVDAVLIELVQAAGGRTLGLFSTSAAAARAAEAVRAATGLTILLQGEDSPRALAARFAADAKTCLFGTRSFWQGIDVPGSACQLVVIDRIPFGHVEDPLSKARLAAAGPRGFAEVTLPPAAVLLAQGAGRLLRATTDRGVVAVLDPRLSRASYAGTLLATMAPFYRARSKEAVLASLRAIDASAPPIAVQTGSTMEPVAG